MGRKKNNGVLIWLPRATVENAKPLCRAGFDIAESEPVSDETLIQWLYCELSVTLFGAYFAAPNPRLLRTRLTREGGALWWTYVPEDGKKEEKKC